MSKEVIKSQDSLFRELLLWVTVPICLHSLRSLHPSQPGILLKLVIEKTKK